MTSLLSTKPSIVREQTPAMEFLRHYSLHATVIVGLTLVIFRQWLLPARFFYDGAAIQKLALGQAFTSDTSYKNTGIAYATLGLADNAFLAGMFAFVLFLIAMLVTRMRGQNQSYGTATVILTVISVFLGAVYLGYYSKDAFVLPITLLVLLTGKKLWGDVAVVGAMVLFASVMRGYWFIVVILFVGFRIILLRRIRFPLLVLITLAATAAAAFALVIALHVEPDYFRTSVNDGRVNSADAASAITPFVSFAQPVGGVVNILITLVSLVIPVPLAAKGGIYYVILAGLILVMWICVFVNARVRVRTLGKGDGVYARCLAYVLAFLVTQSLFEPDYGSALRHLTPLLPAMIFLTGRRLLPAVSTAPNLALAEPLGSEPELFDPHQTADSRHSDLPTPIR